MLDILEELLKLSYFGIFLILIVINTIPILMPPSWTVLSSFHVAEPKLSILALTIIGATGSLLGRIILMQISTNFRIFIRKEKISSFDHLYAFFRKKDMVIFWHHFFIHYHHPIQYHVYHIWNNESPFNWNFHRLLDGKSRKLLHNDLN